MFRNLLARMRATPVWVWISILLAAGVLVVTWLIYRQKQTNASTSSTPASDTAGYVPADGSGNPIWPVDTSGMSGNGYADLLAYLQYIQNSQTPNSPTTAAPSQPVTRPTLPTRPVLLPAPQVPARLPVTGTGQPLNGRPIIRWP